MPVEVEVRVKEIIPRTYNVKSFRVDVSNRADFKAGQYLIVTLLGGADLKRPLSISSSPTEAGYLEFTKKLTESDFSKGLDNLKAGDLVKIKYPYGNFTFDAQKKKIAFLSGGIGITPIRSICKYVVDTKVGTDVALLYGNHSVKDVAFRDDFDIMQKEYPRLRAVHVLCVPDEGCKGPVGHITKQVIVEHIPDYSERTFYICGPPGMVKAMQTILLDELKVPAGNIVLENFAGYQ